MDPELHARFSFKSLSTEFEDAQICNVETCLLKVMMVNPIPFLDLQDTTTHALQGESRSSIGGK